MYSQPANAQYRLPPQQQQQPSPPPAQPPLEQQPTQLPPTSRLVTPELLNSPDFQLVRASGLGQLNEVRRLVKVRGNVNARGLRPIIGALDDERDEGERLEEYSTALHAAAANGHRLVVRYLLKKHADIDLLTFPNSPARAQSRCTPLIFATMFGHSPIVKTLLARSADVNASMTTQYGGTSPLACASIRIDDLLARRLLREVPDTERPIFNNETAFFRAACFGRLRIAELLYESGARVYPTDPRMRGDVLHQACWKGHVHMVEWLVNHGVPIDFVDKDGDTALMRSVKIIAQYPRMFNLPDVAPVEPIQSWVAVATHLVNGGANIHELRDQSGKTVLELIPPVDRPDSLGGVASAAITALFQSTSPELQKLRRLQCLERCVVEREAWFDHRVGVIDEGCQLGAESSALIAEYMLGGRRLDSLDASVVEARETTKTVPAHRVPAELLPAQVPQALLAQLNNLLQIQQYYQNQQYYAPPPQLSVPPQTPGPPASVQYPPQISPPQQPLVPAHNVPNLHHHVVPPPQPQSVSSHVTSHSLHQPPSTAQPQYSMYGGPPPMQQQQQQQPSQFLHAPAQYQQQQPPQYAQPPPLSQHPLQMGSGYDHPQTVVGSLHHGAPPPHNAGGSMSTMPSMGMEVGSAAAAAAANSYSGLAVSAPNMGLPPSMSGGGLSSTSLAVSTGGLPLAMSSTLLDDDVTDDEDGLLTSGDETVDGVSVGSKRKRSGLGELNGGGGSGGDGQPPAQKLKAASGGSQQ